jgi:hypothetical protein
VNKKTVLKEVNEKGVIERGKKEVGKNLEGRDW